MCVSRVRVLMLFSASLIFTALKRDESNQHKKKLYHKVPPSPPPPSSSFIVDAALTRSLVRFLVVVCHLNANISWNTIALRSPLLWLKVYGREEKKTNHLQILYACCVFSLVFFRWSLLVFFPFSSRQLFDRRKKNFFHTRASATVPILSIIIFVKTICIIVFFFSLLVMFSNVMITRACMCNISWKMKNMQEKNINCGKKQFALFIHWFIYGDRLSVFFFVIIYSYLIKWWCVSQHIFSNWISRARWCCW